MGRDKESEGKKVKNQSRRRLKKKKKGWAIAIIRIETAPQRFRRKPALPKLERGV